MYKKCYQGKKLGFNTYEMHLWESDDKHQIIPWENYAYVEDKEKYTCRGLNGEYLRPTLNWHTKNVKAGFGVEGPEYKVESFENNSPAVLHFHDLKNSGKYHQKFLVERYGVDDTPSTGHKELYFDIECEMLDSFEWDEIMEARKPITSIAFWDKKSDTWGCLVWDPKEQVIESKPGEKLQIVSFKKESDMLIAWVEVMRDRLPDIIIGYNSDLFDMPYLYHRICNVCGKDIADQMSPLYGYIDEPVISRKFNKYFSRTNRIVDIQGVESLDYMWLHKKYSWKDEPSWKLDAIGEKYANIKKIEYDGNLNDLYEDDINKFVEYNFRDVEILKVLDEKLDYIALTRNLSHKGKHNYSEVYANTNTQDGAISAYLLGQGIIPPGKEQNPKKKRGYAGGWLFCPEAGLYENMFDLDLTSLYPAIIRTLNIGKETYVGRIVDADDRNNRLGLNDLKSMDQNNMVKFENIKGLQEQWEVGKIVQAVEKGKYRVAANGSFFSSKKQSTLSIVLEKWFNERVEYKNQMKKAYNAGDKEKGKYYYLMQYTMKILLNSLYGATAVPTFRYGMNRSLLSEAITLSGHRIIQESALCANKYYNKIMEGELPKEQFIKDLNL
tara:strand:+ start:119 stop:1948 length:1830 start_codon:yes stop_codon:yes gene_type:complete